MTRGLKWDHSSFGDLACVAAGRSDELASGVDRMLPSSTPSGSHTPSIDSYAPRSSMDIGKG
jgi:hypothetical protein